MYAVFFYFLVLNALFIFGGFSFLGENDDWVLWYFLKGGEKVTLILSYPLSSFLSFLYEKFPNGQWYSITIFLYLILISFLASYWIYKIKDMKLKILFIVAVSLIFIHFLMNVTVTELTILVIIFSFPFVYENQLIFWLLILLASLLRIQIILALFPIFFFAYLILFKKSGVSKKTLFLIIPIVFLVVFISKIPYPLQKDYKDWLLFVKARSYFMDLHGKDENNILNEDEKFVNHSWWAQDNAILPTDKVIAAADFSSANIILNSYKDLTFVKLFKIFLRHKLLFLLIPLSLYFIYSEKSIYKKVLYVSFLSAVFTLIIARDMERVAYPLIILWSLLIVLKLYKEKKEILYKFLSVAIVILFLESTLTRIYKYDFKEEVKKEAMDLMSKHPFVYEFSFGFPSSFGLLSMVIIEDHLFDEKNWFSLNKNRLLLSGWVSRHPYFYKSHNISFGNKKRKFDDYHQFLIDKNTAFIGGKDIDLGKAEEMLLIYDKKYPKKGCHHEIKKIDTSKHFLITQIGLVCEKEF